MDAFSHCLEAYSSPHYHPMSQGIAVEGMRLVKENILKVYERPDDIEARGHMMSAATMGATAFQKGLGAMHALAHPIGAIHHTHHGTTNAVVMRKVVEFNREAIETKIISLARYLDIPGKFEGFCDFISETNQALGIPKTLTDLGVQDPNIDRLVRDALADPSCGGNPIEMTESNTRKLIEDCL